MALLTTMHMQKMPKDRVKVHDKVHATYFTFRDIDGHKYFQIDTYGRDERAIPNKISQSFQIDRETALFLIELLQKEFSP